MVRYEDIKNEIQLSQMEIEDEVNYYQQKIEEFQRKKETAEKIKMNCKRKLDQYVLMDYKRDPKKAWLHFMITEKTDETFMFFDKFFGNTGFQISRYEKTKVNFLLNPEKIVNLKKSAKILKALFEVVNTYNVEDFKIQVINMKKNKTGKLFIFKNKDSYILKAEDAKRAIIREDHNVLFLDKISSYTGNKE